MLESEGQGRLRQNLHLDLESDSHPPSVPAWLQPSADFLVSACPQMSSVFVHYGGLLPQFL